MRRLSLFFLLILSCVAFACRSETPKNTDSASVTASGESVYTATFDVTADAYGAVDPTKISDSQTRARAEKIAETLKQTPSVLRLENLDETRREVQEIALRDARFVRETRDEKLSAPLFNEIFGIYELRGSDINNLTAQCRTQKCFRVEMYNFARNLTTNAFVNYDTKQVIVVTRLPDTAPDIPAHLTELASHIAANAEQTIQAFGKKPDEKSAMMPNTKTSLNKTRCERSQHLCVAPTFVAENGKALWAIVDLTDLALVGLRWTQVGANGQPTESWSQKVLQNDILINKFCRNVTHFERGDWSLDYILTSSDGLRVSDVKFKGKTVFKDAKLVDWHVNYSKSDNFGYSDAVGCPVFSQAAVVAVNGPRDESLMENGKEIGFQLHQDFWSEGYPEPCNYYYDQHFRFYNDGSFRFAVASNGRGCGNDGTYRPVLRIALADEYRKFAQWNGASWQDWTHEQWALQENVPYTAQGFQYRISDANGRGFYIEPANKQFNDGGRGDNAFVYVTRRDASRDEGDSDLTTIGGCCNTDFRQGPEKFIEPQPEKLGDAPFVVWYVPQLKNDDTPGSQYCWAETVVENGVYKVKTYPCFAGPKLHPTDIEAE